MTQATSVGTMRAKGPGGVRIRDRLHLNASVVSLLAGALLWELVGRLGHFFFMPPLSVVIARLLDLLISGRILPALFDSLVNLVVGFGISVVIGTGIGLLMGAYRAVDAALRIYVTALLTAPSIAFAPIFFSFFGVGRTTVVAVIVMYSIFFVIVTTADAIRTVPAPLIDMGLSFNATSRQLFQKVMIPASMPLIMAGVRISAARAVKGMINGELFIAAIGLGQFILRASHVFDIPTVLAVVMLVVIIAIVVGRLVLMLDARLTSWVPEVSRPRGRAGVRE